MFCHYHDWQIVWTSLHYLSDKLCLVTHCVATIPHPTHAHKTSPRLPVQRKWSFLLSFTQWHFSSPSPNHISSLLHPITFLLSFTQSHFSATYTFGKQSDICCLLSWGSQQMSTLWFCALLKWHRSGADNEKTESAQKLALETNVQPLLQYTIYYLHILAIYTRPQSIECAELMQKAWPCYTRRLTTKYSVCRVSAEGMTLLYVQTDHKV